MSAAQILMMPVSAAPGGMVMDLGPALNSDASAGEQFGSLLEQVIGKLQAAETRLSAIPELSAEIPMPELGLELSKEEEFSLADTDLLSAALLSSDYQQMAAIQQYVVASGNLDTLYQDENATVENVAEIIISEQQLQAVLTESGEPILSDGEHVNAENSQNKPVVEQVTAYHNQAAQVSSPEAQALKTAQPPNNADPQTARLVSEPVASLQVPTLQTKLEVPQQTQSQQVQPQQALSEKQLPDNQGLLQAVESVQNKEPVTPSKIENRVTPELHSAVQNPVTSQKQQQASTSPLFRFSNAADVTLEISSANGSSNRSGMEQEAGRNNQSGQSGMNMAFSDDLETGIPVTAFKTEAMAQTRPIEQHLSVLTPERPVSSAAQHVAEKQVHVQPEQVMRQVTERLSGHEVKNGVEQISFKLSPEHLGNLQLNFRMEDQRLKLEIVAESRGVRDALLQQSDDLKESLLRQNIKVDSFDVTTNNGNSMSQQQRDWRQMAAEQRQQQAAFAPGRNGADLWKEPETPVRYFAKQYNSTIDVRF